MFKSIATKLANIAGRNQYAFDPAITTYQLLAVILGRFVMLARWNLFRFRLGKSNLMGFLGRRVDISYPQQLSAEKGVYIGDGCIINCLSKSKLRLGKSVSIKQNCIIECTGVYSELGDGITIGDNVGISQNCFIQGRGPVTIGNDVIFGPNCQVFSENHVSSSTQTPIRLQGTHRQGVTIGDDVWIGAGSIILDGSVINQGSIIAAGSVVRGVVPSFSVFGGIPARKIKSR